MTQIFVRAVFFWGGGEQRGGLGAPCICCFFFERVVDFDKRINIVTMTQT